MKTINTYIIEKLKISSKSYVPSSFNVDDTFEIILPNCQDWKIQDPAWKRLTLPDAKYVIYVDYYDCKLPHFANIEDMLFMICVYADDFENFNPSEDILYASNSFNDVIVWYVENYIGLKDWRKYTYDELELEEKITLKNKDIHDDSFFLAKYINLSDSECEKQYNNGSIDFKLNTSDVKPFLKKMVDLITD